MATVKLIISLDIKTDKPPSTVIKAVERGIYRGLDTHPYHVAPPKDVKINYNQER